MNIIVSCSPWMIQEAVVTDDWIVYLKTNKNRQLKLTQKKKMQL